MSITTGRSVRKKWTRLPNTFRRKLTRRTTGLCPRDPAPDLSGREQSVLILLTWGYTNKEAAARLGLSVKTIDTYRLRLVRKVGFRSRVDMVAFAAERGWLAHAP